MVLDKTGTVTLAKLKVVGIESFGASSDELLRIATSVKNLGWRVDHIWATRPLAEKSTRTWIDSDPRLKEKPSDHTFVVAEFEK